MSGFLCGYEGCIGGKREMDTGEATQWIRITFII